MTQVYGHEMLGAAKYKDLAIKKLPAGRAGKVFMNTFGDALPVLIGWAKKGVHPILAAQATWAGSSHNYNPSHYLKTAIKEAKRLNSVARDYPHIQFLFSLYCEHELSQSRMLHDIQEVLPYASHLKIFNSPNLNGILLPGFPDEPHGKYNPSGLKPPYYWACDGMSAYDADMLHWLTEHAEADVIWLWIAQYNLKKNASDKTDISDRQVRPVEKQIISADYLIQHPKGNCKLRADSLWKSHADQHSNKPAPREQKPVLITPVSADSASLYASNGKKIYALERKGNFTDGRPLYRGPDRGSLWGYEIAEKARKISGSSVVAVKILGINLGTVNPAWRQNDYRKE